MKFTRMLRAIALGAAAILAIGGCGTGEGAADNANKVTIGVKFDQPGLAQKQPDGSLTGFDIDVARHIATELGYEEDQIEFKEAVSAERENMIKRGDVDFIVATYSITDERKAEVDFAGPYFVAHQDLLVRADETTIAGPETLNGKKLCSVTGSTSAQRVKEEFATKVDLQEYNGYSECITGLENKAVDAITTDDTILAGLAIQNQGKFKLVGEGFSDEYYGVGLKKGDSELRSDINTAIQKMFDDGQWKAMVERHLGEAVSAIPEPPEITER